LPATGQFLLYHLLLQSVSPAGTFFQGQGFARHGATMFLLIRLQSFSLAGTKALDVDILEQLFLGNEKPSHLKGLFCSYANIKSLVNSLI
jgi:hypothetical protein